MNQSQNSQPSADTDDQYVVVARRYRPQSFDELIGQSHVQKALGNAIDTGRVGHAYLFTGPRGVGKTTTARIFAKALNCDAGPTIEPCNACDTCRMIANGEDIDVIEIDGASNNGIDEIRTLRRNVSVLPSRCRFKLYIIDEVHMLSRQAFNGLLKTLEEPPDHVKFMFCTTDPDKIPITVLSRCQRFDLVPVNQGDILKRLQYIVQSEGRQADESALELVAKRAHGSMRDSQSLLEQLMAFCSETITVDDVHGLLGTAASSRIIELISHLSRRDAAAAIGCLHQLWKTGSEPEQVAQQLMGVYRDTLAVAVGGGQEIMEFTQRDEFSQVQNLADSMGQYTCLAALEILQELFRKLRSSVQIRVLIEMTVIRIATLEELDEIQNWLNVLQSPQTLTQSLSPETGQGSDGHDAREKKNETVSLKDPLRTDGPAITAPFDSVEAELSTEDQVILQNDTERSETETAPVSASGSINKGFQPTGLVITKDNLETIWTSVCSELDDLVASALQGADSVTLADENHLVVKFPHNYTFQKETCERPERMQKLTAVLKQITGGAYKVTFELMSRRENGVEKVQAAVKSPRQRSREAEEHPLVQQAVETFEAEIIRVDHPR
ncbi:MAG: DNA polymerase III subunit gamma/tau [Planctomycetota bacterium]|nr:DNA polymerase III subunit gamma/tau [Planctomycetota bacterium]